jgi:hypothetical protein
LDTNLKEIGIQLAGYGPGEKGLTGTWRTIKEASFGRCNSNPLEELWV